MVAAFQMFTDQAISKIVNLNRDVDTEEIIEVILKAFQHQLTGITVYVDQTRSDLPMNL